MFELLVKALDEQMSKTLLWDPGGQHTSLGSPHTSNARTCWLPPYIMDSCQAMLTAVASAQTCPVVAA